MTAEEWPVTEEWRAIAGYDGWYEVSDHGRVRSWKPRGTRRGRAETPSLRAPAAKDFGHLCLVLYAPGAKPKARTVHQLVAEAFIGPRPEGFDTCHNDGDPSNNHVSNLRYATHAENAADMLRHGTQAKGEAHGMAKLTEPDVLEIKRLLREGKLMSKEIAERYGVSGTAIAQIKRGKNWGWLDAA